MAEHVYNVYLMDVYQEPDGLWVENCRNYMGEMTVKPKKGSEPEPADILASLKAFSFRVLPGRMMMALTTTDRRRVYAEDYYGTGEWWEVGTVKGHKPVYGLERVVGL